MEYGGDSKYKYEGIYDIDYQETNHIEDKYRELLKKANSQMTSFIGLHIHQKMK